MLLPTIDDVDTPDCAADRNRAVVCIYVIPFQGTYFTDAQPGAEADVNAEPCTSSSSGDSLSPRHGRMWFSKISA